MNTPKFYEVGGGEIVPVYLMPYEIAHVVRIRTGGLLCRDFQQEDTGVCSQLNNPNQTCSYTFDTKEGRREVHICMIETAEHRHAQELIDAQL